MNAVDDIRIRAGVDSVSDEEAVAVLVWCRHWAADCDWADGVDVLDVPALLRGCDRHIEGGIRFVLEDVRRCTVRRGEAVA